LELHFNELNGTTVYDLSGYNNNGTIYGALRVNEGFVRALSFDGVDDFVEVPDSPSIRLTSNMAFELWLKILSAKETGADVVLSKGAYPNRHYRLEISWDLRRFVFGSDGSGFRYTPLGSVNPFIGRWIHLCFNRNNEEGWIELRVNFNEGVWRYTFTPGTTEPSDTYPLHLARSPNVLIDEVLIYNRALSEEEIKTLYNYYTKKKIFER